MTVALKDIDDDPYELHAQHFADRLQQLSREFHDSNASVDKVASELTKYWPQVLAAFRWATSQRSQSATAEQVVQSLMACAEGDIRQLQFLRTAADVRRWADATSAYARKSTNANDAAFLFRFAGVALAQSAILDVVESTRLDMDAVLKQMGAFAVPQGTEKEQPRDAQSSRAATLDPSMRSLE